MHTSKSLSHKPFLVAAYFLAIVVLIAFAPGAKAQSGNVYGNSQAQVMAQTQKGVVLQVNTKTVEPSGIARTGGAAIGGVLGSLLGSQVDGQARNAVMMLGTTLGGFLGESVARATMSSQAQELVIGLFNPQTGALSSTVTVVQPEPFEAMSRNQQVIVSNTNGVVRVIKTNYDAQTVSLR